MPDFIYHQRPPTKEWQDNYDKIDWTKETNTMPLATSKETLTIHPRDSKTTETGVIQ